MNNEPNKPIPAQELSEEELAGIVGGVTRYHGEDRTDFSGDSSLPDFSDHFTLSANRGGFGIPGACQW